MPMRHDALAMVYAKSLFELAEQAGGQSKTEEVNAELSEIIELARGDRAFDEFLSSPIIDRGRRADALRRIFNGRITDLALRFMMVLNDKGRLNKLADIAEAHDHLLQEAFGRIEVDVMTAGTLSGDALEFVRERVRSALNKEPVLHTYNDPGMIGGVKLRIGDQLIDGSLSSRLRRLKEDVLASGGAVRERAAWIIEDELEKE